MRIYNHSPGRLSRWTAPHQSGARTEGRVLDAANDTRTDDRYIHPTRGWRQRSPKSSLAAMITAERKAGYPWPLARRKAALRAL